MAHGSIFEFGVKTTMIFLRIEEVYVLGVVNLESFHAGWHLALWFANTRHGESMERFIGFLG